MVKSLMETVNSQTEIPYQGTVEATRASSFRPRMYNRLPTLLAIWAINSRFWRRILTKRPYTSKVPLLGTGDIL